MTADATFTLHQWLSPAFPIGGFSYSHGLETLIAQGRIDDAETAQNWIASAIRHGAGQSDAILLSAAYQTLPDDLPALSDLARALSPSSERLKETDQLGAAFARTIRDLHGFDLDDAPYPVAFGRAASLAGLPLSMTLCLFVQAFAANLISVAVRLVPLGQTRGQQITLALAPDIAQTAKLAEPGNLEDIGTNTIALDLASMAHETLPTRLFQS